MPTKLEARVAQHDREIAAIRKLVLTGMKMLVKMQEEHAAFRREMRELAAAQKRTEAAQKRTEESLRAFIDSMRRGGNGHAKGKVDI